MLDFALEGVDERAVLRENGEVKVVVVVGDDDVAAFGDADADGEVGHALAANLTQEDAVVVEDLHAVGPIVADENFLIVVGGDSVGEFQVLGAGEFAEDASVGLEDHHPHHLALHDYDPAAVVHGDAARVLENVGAEFADEHAVLVVDLPGKNEGGGGKKTLRRLIKDIHQLYKSLYWFTKRR